MRTILVNTENGKSKEIKNQENIDSYLKEDLNSEDIEIIEEYEDSIEEMKVEKYKRSDRYHLITLCHAGINDTSFGEHCEIVKQSDFDEMYGW